jgi:hypothetical protein
VKVRKKPIILDAEVATADGEIETLEGTHAYRKGDVIMTGTRGERWPVKREIFAETYDIVEFTAGEVDADLQVFEERTGEDPPA